MKISIMSGLIDFLFVFLVNLLPMAKSKEIKSRICEHNKVIIVYPFQVGFYFWFYFSLVSVCFQSAFVYSSLKKFSFTLVSISFSAISSPH